ncbi:zinc knuckle protein [Trichinella spiralis]|uniref:zinc knuckle protein n=1 Tax=Trichinella spiralis TaxID=6334 RepID=UPI0001EFD022|nr:zinc knuckle protein [Trichinella spiralis]
MLKLRSVKTSEQKLWRQRHRKLPFEAEEQETRLKELLTEEIPATTRKMEARRRRRARSGHKNCWSCGGVGHISQDCDMCNGRGRASGELQLRLYFLHSHLDFFPQNFGHVSEEQDERFHEDIKQMEQRYHGDGMLQ